MYIHRHGIDFELDDRKRGVNLRKHGIDLVDATDIFSGPMLIVADLRVEYGEDRWIAVGEVQDRTIVVAFAEHDQGTRIRLISARKALTHERHALQEALANALEGRRPTPRR